MEEQEQEQEQEPDPMQYETTTQFGDIPEVIVINCIFSELRDTRTRNRVALVCKKWREMERATRETLVVRGNISSVHTLPPCFQSVTKLDLSALSPWGYPALDPCSMQGRLSAHYLKQCFPNVVDVTVYVRNGGNVEMVASLWPRLNIVKLVRWHQRCVDPEPAYGEEIAPILQHCTSIHTLDLSEFYCWTVDVPSALQAHAATSACLKRLDLMRTSSEDVGGNGFKASEFGIITSCCRNLEELKAVCIFDTRFMDFLTDEDLALLGSNCPKLKLLHLVDSGSVVAPRRDPDQADECSITRNGLETLFRSLALLEDLVLEFSQNVVNSAPAIACLASHCKRLRILRVAHFQDHGVAFALCNGLESLAIKLSVDLNDAGIQAIASGCARLSKFEIHGCNHVTEIGLNSFARGLERTLSELRVSYCRNLDTATILRALAPVRNNIRRLHIDCVWEPLSLHKQSHLITPKHCSCCNNGVSDVRFFDFMGVNNCSNQIQMPCNCSMEVDMVEANYLDEFYSMERGRNTWRRLSYLSLWIPVGEMLTPLVRVGLGDCPALEEIKIQVVGDCRFCPKPEEKACGLSCLEAYPKLHKLELNCSDVIGYALTSPVGMMDLSLWERWYLKGLPDLCLDELNYWPPQDRDMNRRGLSLPATAFLSQCGNLRKLFIHGTAHEHFMRMFLDIMNLRDMQLREDYYPAHEDDTSTEMRTDSCWRFEEALRNRGVYD